MNSKKLSYVVLQSVAVMGLLCGEIFSAWSIDDPKHDEQFTTTATIAGSGDANASEGTGLVAKVRIGGSVENSKSGNVTAYQNWQIDVPDPTGGWSCSDFAYFELWEGGTKHETARIKISDSSCI